MLSSLKETLELAAKLVGRIVGYVEFFVNSVNSNIFIRLTSYDCLTFCTDT